MVWEQIPNEVYVGKDTLEFGLYDAVAHFNMGAETVLLLFEALEIPRAFYTRLLYLNIYKKAAVKTRTDK